MISEGYCDSEDWSNDAANSALANPSFFTVYLNQIHEAFVSIRAKNLILTPTFSSVVQIVIIFSSM